MWIEATQKVPLLTPKVGGDVAAGSSAINIASACSKEDTLSSLENNMSLVMVLLGEDIGTKPVENLPDVGDFSR